MRSLWDLSLTLHRREIEAPADLPKVTRFVPG